MADLDRSKHEGMVIYLKSMPRGQMRASMVDGGNIAWVRFPPSPSFGSVELNFLNLQKGDV